MGKVWHKLFCNKRDLQLRGTLNGGQSFRWKVKTVNNKEQWIGVFAGKVWILEQDDDTVSYQVHERNENEENPVNYEMLLKKYFRLDMNLQNYFKLWSEVDPYFKEAAKEFYGIRILDQEVTENIFSFICSSNNNISRISSMVEKLAKFYGKEICKIEGESYFAFPTIDELKHPSVEKKLRENGFGYRAKYINQSAQIILQNGGMKWIEELKAMNYEDSKKKLMTLTGIGAKVADCICLMSLGHLESIPVDTHIYQIAAKYYIPKLSKQKTVTEKIYKFYVRRSTPRTILLLERHFQHCSSNVADCICLMSLGHLESIPVDTHIYQIAAKYYIPKLSKQKTVTEKIYNEIANHFRGLYGPLAGWAHTVLFCADLKKFATEENEGGNNIKKRKLK